jgi:hypothetical protein
MLAFSLSAVALSTAAIPTLDELGGNWIDPYQPLSKHAPAAPELAGNKRDLATINNFWGAVGISPQTVRPVDLFAVNSVELPPFAGCGANNISMPYGCGRLMIDNKHVQASMTKWAAHEASRRSEQLESGLVIETSTRMPYEQNGVIWQVNLTNNNSNGPEISPTVTFELPGTIQQFVTLDWVYEAPNDPSKFNYSATSLNGQKGVLSQSTSPASPTSRPAAALFLFAGSVQPDQVSTASLVPSATFTALSIKPGDTVTIRVAFAVGNNPVEVVKTATGTPCPPFHLLLSRPFSLLILSTLHSHLFSSIRRKRGDF